MLQVGIVGLPNVGKSTLFNALTETNSATAENFPFCTIDPNIGIVSVPDHRMNEIASFLNPEKVIPTAIKFVDIAGLVKGASQGEGLGNKFLSHIREVDAILLVSRFFENSDITHVEGNINPDRDADTILTELKLADLDTLSSAIPKLEKRIKSNDKDAKIAFDAYTKAKEALSNGDLVIDIEFSEDEAKQLKNLSLLTNKPIIFAGNVSEENVNNKFEVLGKPAVVFSAKIESEMIGLSKEEKIELLETFGMKESGLNRLVKDAYEKLNLITYFTAGPKELRAWTIKKGDTAPKAGGVIHTDFEKKFIRAEVISINDYIENKGEKNCKEKGKIRSEGKEYIVKDGDLMEFLHS